MVPSNPVLPLLAKTDCSSSEIKTNTSPSEKTVISKKRLAKLEYIEKNLQAIIQAAVDKSCPDCKNNTCNVNK